MEPVLIAKMAEGLSVGNGQSERYAREGVELSLSTLADQVGACAAALRPLHALIQAHVLAAERLHGDDTTVPILAKGQTETGRVWVYVRDDRPFGGKDPPAALFHASRDRTREHPEQHLANYAGILQPDAFDGYNRRQAPPRWCLCVHPGRCCSKTRLLCMRLGAGPSSGTLVIAIARRVALISGEHLA